MTLADLNGEARPRHPSDGWGEVEEVPALVLGEAEPRGSKACPSDAPSASVTSSPASRPQPHGCQSAVLLSAEDLGAPALSPPGPDAGHPGEDEQQRLRRRIQKLEANSQALQHTVTALMEGDVAARLQRLEAENVRLSGLVDSLVASSHAQAKLLKSYGEPALATRVAKLEVENRRLADAVSRLDDKRQAVRQLSCDRAAPLSTVPLSWPPPGLGASPAVTRRSWNLPQSHSPAVTRRSVPSPALGARMVVHERLRSYSPKPRNESSPVTTASTASALGGPSEPDLRAALAAHSPAASAVQSAKTPSVPPSPVQLVSTPRMPERLAPGSSAALGARTPGVIPRRTGAERESVVHPPAWPVPGSPKQVWRMPSGGKDASRKEVAHTHVRQVLGSSVLPRSAARTFTPPCAPTWRSLV